jgi:hypothetical protein
MTLQQAISKANRIAKRDDKVVYVVKSDTPEVTGVYTTADDYDMDTFFAGISDSAIVYCSADGLVR